MLRGDCKICINGKLPSYSATCTECGLSRKNFKPITNYDRIVSKTPEELARLLASNADCNECRIYSYKDGCMESYDTCVCQWLNWLKEEEVPNAKLD